MGPPCVGSLHARLAQPEGEDRSLTNRRSQRSALGPTMIVGVLASSATDAAAAAETREANAGDEGELGVGGPFGDETSPPPPEIRAKKSPLVHLVKLPGVPMDPGVPSDARRFVSRLTNGVGAESSGGFAAFLDISAPSPTPPRHMESSVSALHLGNARSLVVNVACAVRWHPTENCPAYGTRSSPVGKNTTSF